MKPVTTINYNLPPQELFFIPGVDSGLSVLRPNEWAWRPGQRAKIAGYSVSAYDNHNQAVDIVIDQATRSRVFESTIEFNSIPAVAQNLSVVTNCMGINGKWLLSGAGGARVRNRSVWRSSSDPIEVDTQTDAYLSQFQGPDSAMQPLAQYDGDYRALPYVIDARNLHNYYHFLTETLPRLQIPIDIDHTGPIYICYKGEQVSGFPKRLIEALYPEIADRVEFVESPLNIPQAVIDFSWDHYHAVAPDHIVPSISPLIPAGQKWLNNSTARTARRILDLNAFNTLLVKLRERALTAIKGMDVSHLPKRFWVTRDPSSPRARMMKNEEALVAELEKLGFQSILFENYSPLEQIALMANAEVMASHHGAAFANMLFAGPDTQVIEIGTPQTAMVRWADFFPLAHAAQAQYTTFFADMDWATPEIIPNFDKDGHIAVSVTPNAIKSIVDFIACNVGAYPEKIGRKRLLQNLEVLDKTGKFAAAIGLMEQYDNQIQGDLELMRMYVRMCTELDLPEKTFKMLSAIWLIDQSKPASLERLIWLCRRTDQLELAPELVAEHRQRFPNRHDAFRKKIRWFDRLEQA